MKISIVIPVYNTIKYLENCVRSILNQKYKNVEIILVDDGSTDGSSKLCDTLACNHSEITVHHQENRGVSAARNFGIMKATGDYILFLDSDDQLSPDALIKSAELIKKYNCDMIAWSLVSEKNGKYNYFHMCAPFTVAGPEDTELLEDLRYRAISGYSHSGAKDYSMNFLVTKLIKKEIIINNNLWFDSALRYREDSLFVMQLMECITSAVAIDEFFYIRTLHNDSATASACKEIRQMNEGSTKKFESHIQSYHAGQDEYKIFLVKQKFAAFIQILKLDYFNPILPYSILQRRKLFQNLACDSLYSECKKVSIKEYGLKYKVVSLIIKFKLSFAIYLILKLKYRTK